MKHHNLARHLRYRARHRARGRRQQARRDRMRLMAAIAAAYIEREAREQC